MVVQNFRISFIGPLDFLILRGLSKKDSPQLKRLLNATAEAVKAKGKATKFISSQGLKYWRVHSEMPEGLDLLVILCYPPAD